MNEEIYLTELLSSLEKLKECWDTVKFDAYDDTIYCNNLNAHINQTLKDYDMYMESITYE